MEGKTTYILTEMGDTSDLLSPIKTSTRIKYTCVSISKNYFAFGANTGGIYFFSKKNLKYLRVLSCQDGPIEHVQFSPDDNIIACATSGGVVKVWIINLESRDKAKCLKTVEDEGGKITDLHWAGVQRLFVGDDKGCVKLAHIPSTKSLKSMIPRATENVLKEENTPVVQMDYLEERLLVSTTTRCLLCLTTKNQFSQIGSKPRDGQFGACFLPQKDGTPVIYSARPGSRLWQASLEGQVLATQQYKKLLAIPPAQILKPSHDPLFTPVEKKTWPSQSFNFSRFLLIRDHFLVTWHKSALYILDLALGQVVSWYNQFTDIYDVCCCGKSEIFIFHSDGQLSWFSFFTATECVAHFFSEKQWIICAQVALEFREELIPASARIQCSVHMLNKVQQRLQYSESSKQVELLVSQLEELKQHLEEVVIIEEEDGSSIEQEGSVTEQDNGRDTGVDSGVEDDDTESVFSNSEQQEHVSMREFGKILQQQLKADPSFDKLLQSAASVALQKLKHTKVLKESQRSLSVEFLPTAHSSNPNSRRGSFSSDQGKPSLTLSEPVSRKDSCSKLEVFDGEEIEQSLGENCNAEVELNEVHDEPKPVAGHLSGTEMPLSELLPLSTDEKIIEDVLPKTNKSKKKRPKVVTVDIDNPLFQKSESQKGQPMKFKKFRRTQSEIKGKYPLPGQSQMKKQDSTSPKIPLKISSQEKTEEQFLPQSLPSVVSKAKGLIKRFMSESEGGVVEDDSTVSSLTDQEEEEETGDYSCPDELMLLVEKSTTVKTQVKDPCVFYDPDALQTILKEWIEHLEASNKAIDKINKSIAQENEVENSSREVDFPYFLDEESFTNISYLTMLCFDVGVLTAEEGKDIYGFCSHCGVNRAHHERHEDCKDNIVVRAEKKIETTYSELSPIKLSLDKTINLDVECNSSSKETVKKSDISNLGTENSAPLLSVLSTSGSTADVEHFAASIETLETTNKETVNTDDINVSQSSEQTLEKENCRSVDEFEDSVDGIPEEVEESVSINTDENLEVSSKEEQTGNFVGSDETGSGEEGYTDNIIDSETKTDPNICLPDTETQTDTLLVRSMLEPAAWLFPCELCSCDMYNQETDRHVLRDCDRAHFISKYFSLLDMNKVRNSLKLQGGHRSQTWCSLVQSLNRGIDLNDSFSLTLFSSDHDNLLQMLQDGIHTEQAVVPLILTRLYEHNAEGVVIYCADELSGIIPWEVVQICFHQSDVSSVHTNATHFLLYVEHLSKTNLCKGINGSKTLVELCHDLAVMRALVHSVLIVDNQDTSQTNCSCGKPRSGSHMKVWNHEDILDVVLDHVKQMSDANEMTQLSHLFHKHGYWKGFVSASLWLKKTRDALDTIVFTGNVKMLEHCLQKDGLTLSEEDWQYLLKTALENRSEHQCNLIKGSVEESMSIGREMCSSVSESPSDRSSLDDGVPTHVSQPDMIYSEDISSHLSGQNMHSSQEKNVSIQLSGPSMHSSLTDEVSRHPQGPDLHSSFEESVSSPDLHSFLIENVSVHTQGTDMHSSLEGGIPLYSSGADVHLSLDECLVTSLPDTLHSNVDKEILINASQTEMHHSLHAHDSAHPPRTVTSSLAEIVSTHPVRTDINRDVTTSSELHHNSTFVDVTELCLRHCGPVNTLGYLSDLSAETLPLSVQFYFRCMLITVLDKQQRSIVQTMLEKLNCYLWSQRPATLPPKLHQFKEKEQSGVKQTPKSESPIALTKSLEGAACHWGVNIHLADADCLVCSLPLCEHMSAGTQGLAVFNCGHVYHKHCVPENSCVMCFHQRLNSLFD